METCTHTVHYIVGFGDGTFYAGTDDEPWKTTTDPDEVATFHEEKVANIVGKCFTLLHGVDFAVNEVSLAVS